MNFDSVEIKHQKLERIEIMRYAQKSVVEKFIVVPETHQMATMFGKAEMAEKYAQEQIKKFEVELDIAMAQLLLEKAKLKRLSKGGIINELI